MRRRGTRILSLLLVFVLVFAMAACGSSSGESTTAETEAAEETPEEAVEETEAGTYVPGTYTASAPGLFGDVTVEVTFSADAIEDIQVVESSESEIGQNAIDQIPAKIVETQSLAVDSVSGASYTSSAIFTAVEDCVEQAGGDVEALKSVAIESGEMTEESLETQLIVIGGGAAGMSATIKAQELGIDVILVEKQSYIGGAISMSSGNQVVMGSQMQKDLGVTDDSVESMVEDFLANGNNLNVVELLTLYAENVGETSDWLESLGVTYDLDGGLHELAEYAHNRELAYTGGGSGAGTALRELVESTDATVLLNTRASELLTDENGAVIGVKAASEDTEYTITGDAVLLATGGYGNNKDLLNEEMQGALYYGPVSSTGDGVIMATAEGIDAATRLMEYGKRYPNGIEVSEGTAKSTIDGNIVGWTMSAILIDQEGNRVVNEQASNRTILEVELTQPNQMLYLMLDEETFEAWREKLDSVIGADNIDAYLEANGSATPLFYHADTIEELAELAGIDPEVLTATVERYNGFVEAGVDEDFGRPANYLNMEIGDGPYYLIEQKPRFATTMGGLVVNVGLQVENTSGEVIEGLYAAGEVVGGVMGDDSPSGANNGWALTSGRLAAEYIAAAIGQ